MKYLIELLTRKKTITEAQKQALAINAYIVKNNLNTFTSVKVLNKFISIK